MKTDKKVLWIELGFSLLVAVVLLLVCSKSSPLYPMNDWVDADCIFTVGKAIGEGLVPYKDLFDHKGPFLYFIFFFASLISKSSFIGLWIFEIISVTGFLYFSMQSAKLFIKNKWVYYTLMPIVALICLTAKTFAHGGSTEELALLPLSYSVYYFLKMIRGDKVKTYEHVLLGVSLGSVFWMKFTMVGFYIGAYITLICYRFYKKENEALVKDILLNIAGFMCLTLPIFVYFIVNGALGDLFKIYFYNNIFVYGDSEILSQKLKNVKSRTKNLIYYNTELIVPVFISLAIYLFKEKTKEALLLIAALSTAILGIYFGGYLSYYALILAVFAFLSMGITDEVCKLFKKEEVEKKDNTMYILPFISLAVCFVISFNLSSNVYLMDYSKMDMPQYKFAELINEKEDSTLLNYRFLDGGFYFAAGKTPANKFFCRSNMNVDGMDAEQQQLISDKKVDFVVTRQDSISDFVINCGYECIAQESMYFEGKDRNYFLYKVIE